MKMPFNRSRTGWLSSLVLWVASSADVVRVEAATESPAPASVTATPAIAAPTSAELMRKAYLLLVKESIVPAKPLIVGAAAVEAIRATAPDHAKPLPSNFGSDAERDATWLAECVADLPPVWSIIEAMARSAETAHTGLGTPERRRGMIALSRGQPLCAPGFSLYQLDDGRLVVFDVVKGMSADKSGLRPGDILVRASGRRALGIERFHLATRPAGTQVALEIVRDSEPLALTLTLVPGDVPSVDSRVLNDGIGYIFVRGFVRAENPARNTAALVRDALTTLLQQRARGLVLDLRSSLGGSGEHSIASALCDGDVIYFLQNPLASPMRPVKREGERIWSGPIVVLVNQQTESAPEALALSLRELGHIQIIGQATAGGLTEFSMIPLAEGYSMTLPTGAVRGPITGTTPPSYAVTPDTIIPNPSIEDLRAGRDAQLDAARAAIQRALAQP